MPFTLVNVAAHMGRKDSAGHRWTLWAASVLAGVALTITAHVWLVALVETVSRQVRATYSDEYSGATVVIAVTALLALLIAVRWIYTSYRVSRRSESRMRVWKPAWSIAITSALNLVVVVVLGVVMVTWPPTQIPFEFPLLSTHVPESDGAFRRIVDEFPGSVVDAVCAAHGAGSPLLEWRLNPLAAVVFGGFGFALATSVLLLLIAPFFGAKKTIPTFAGAALIIGVGIALLNAVAATLRLGLEWVMIFLDSQDSLGWLARPSGAQGGGPDERAAVIGAVSERYVLAFQGGIARCHPNDVVPPYATTYYLDSLPLIGLLGLLSLAFGLWLVNRSALQRITRTGDLPAKQVKLEFAHDVVGRLGSRLWIGMLVAIVTWLALVFLVWAAVTQGFSSCNWCSRFVRDAVRVVAQVVAVGAVIFVIWGHPQTVRRIFAMVADIAGFWDPTFHPLAGDTYRHRVIVGLEEEADSISDRDVVLVGHSQGSVIAAWFSANREQPTFALVTCGSPLVSLYQTFFPGYFDDDFLKAVDRGTLCWRNFWRRTDPIATPVLRQIGKPDGDVRLQDPLPVSEVHGAPPPSVRGHSDYWTDPTQMATVVGLMEMAEVAESSEDGAQDDAEEQ
ncbi:hypothetical protein GCM10027024_14960 [Microbacterium insulae]